MVRRSGARAGDDLWVTGTIGDAGAGLRALRGELPAIAQNATRALIRRYRLPEPRVELAAHLAGIAHAALDVSDGLLQDAGHLAKQSKLRCRIELGGVPLSNSLQALDMMEAGVRLAAVRAGDDYEILFAADPALRARVTDLSSRLALPIMRIGRFEPGSGIAVTGQKGETIKMERSGFTHF
jgi:thiamine-monophosphate kinase